jgi:nucleotide-binding universal stress UspA family protein
MLRRILVPVDGSKLAESALVIGGDLAESQPATLIITRVVCPPAASEFYAPSLLSQIEEAQNKEAKAYLATTAERLRQDRLTIETRLLHGEVAPTLVAEALRDHVDLIVITSHGMSGLGSQVFGSVAQKLLYTAPCPVLVTRPVPEELEREEESEATAADEALLEQITGPSS